MMLSHPRSSVPPPCGKHTPVGHLHALRCLKNWVVSSVPRYRGGTVGQQVNVMGIRNQEM
jgi:hypothetical protein